MKEKKILVAGGGGYIGSKLLPVLLKEGYSVRVLDKFYFGKDVISQVRRNHSSQQLDVVEGDIRRVGEEVFEGVDISIDLAGVSNDPTCDLTPELTKSTNYKGTVHFADLAEKAGVDRHIFASSCSVYGDGGGQSLTEKDQTNPLTLYARCKRKSEKELLDIFEDSDSDVILPRFATVFGYSSRMRFDLSVNIMTKYAVQNGKIQVYGTGKQWRPFVHVRDVGRALLQLCETDEIKNEIINVGSNSKNYQIEEIAEKIADAVGGVEIEKVEDKADDRSYEVNFDKIESLLGFEQQGTIEDSAKKIELVINHPEYDPEERRWVTVDQYKHLLETNSIKERGLS